MKAGSAAGKLWTNGRCRNSYRAVRVDGSPYFAHRLAYLIHFGVWPTGEIDHLDHDGLNNRISNLRAVTHAINTRNRRKNSTNTSGVMGVYWHKDSGKWRAQINVNGRRVNLGTFGNIAEAAHVRKLAEQRFSFHENHGMERTAWTA